MPKKKTKGQKKIGKVMREFYKGKLHSGRGGRIVKSRSQAQSIALSMARRMGFKISK